MSVLPFYLVAGVHRRRNLWRMVETPVQYVAHLTKTSYGRPMVHISLKERGILLRWAPKTLERFVRACQNLPSAPSLIALTTPSCAGGFYATTVDALRKLLDDLPTATRSAA